ncbi:MAG: phosphatase PAP2 family protein [Ignavibacteriales bacterium]|nr:phosphatase PAP2 family protein [Ignavibacteriales bacterium]
MNLRRLLMPLTTADVTTVAFLLFLSLLSLLFCTRVAEWFILVPVNILFIGAVYYTAHRCANTPAAPPWINGVHTWYPIALILYVYKQTSFLVRPIRQVDYDQTLISIDRWIFHLNPTQWVHQFAHPVLTEILQLAYASYYVLFIVLFIELYRRGDTAVMNTAIFLVIYGFFLSYIGYLLVPAVGPRFTLHDFRMNDLELPGLWLTPYLRAFINTGGGIPPGATDPLLFVQRDAFPSGHTELTLVAIWIAFNTKVKSRWYLLGIGSLLIAATIYMRYHYVVDDIGGMCVFVFAIWSGLRIDAWWRKKSIA